MRRFFKWLSRRFGTFDLLPEYFTAAGRRMQDILWGALLPFLAWGIWFIVSTPPIWINVTAVGFALFMAGYYVWRADHVRIIPKMRLQDVINLEPMSNQADLSIISTLTIQIVPTCMTDAIIHDCTGYITGISRLETGKTIWVDILKNTSLTLMWNPMKQDLFPGISKPLTVFVISNSWVLQIWSRDTPSALETMFLHARLHESRDVFRFDIRVVSPECPPVDRSLRFEITDDWMKPKIGWMDETSK